MTLGARVCFAAAVAVAAAAVIACGSVDISTRTEHGPADVGATAKAEIKGPQGEAMGTVTLTQGRLGVLVSADLRGLEPGAHGFHIHEKGSCEPDFSAAGDHFAPEGLGHGYLSREGHHAGDLPNIHATDDGTARADFFSGSIAVETGRSDSILDGDGSAIIVHEKADTYGAEAGAGGRVGCGVIERG